MENFVILKSLNVTAFTEININMWLHTLEKNNKGRYMNDYVSIQHPFWHEKIVDVFWKRMQSFFPIGM